MRKLLSTIVVFFLSTVLFGQTLHTLHSDAVELDVTMYNTLFQRYPAEIEEFVDEINRCYPDDTKELSEKGYDGETLMDGYFESFVTITVRIIQDADGNIIHILEGDDFKKFFE